MTDSHIAVDALGDVLKTIRLKGSAYFCADFHSPWGLAIDEGPHGLFHVVIKGGCAMQLENSDEVLHLGEGDIMAFPTGGGHWISDCEASKRTAGTEVMEIIQSGRSPFLGNSQREVNSQEGDAEDKTRLLCGSFEYDTSINHPFLKDLPCFILIKAQETPELEWLRSMVTILAQESRTPTAGSSVIVDRLTEVLFIQLMRFYLSTLQNDLGYMAALSDRQIGKALNLIHGEQEAYWSVEKLGEAVALSRTAFTEKFSKMVGVAPKRYLLDWRMQRAKSNLEAGGMSTYEIAERAGYSSEAAFSKAFKQFFEITPGQVRRS